MHPLIYNLNYIPLKLAWSLFFCHCVAVRSLTPVWGLHVFIVISNNDNEPYVIYHLVASHGYGKPVCFMFKVVQ